MLLQLEGDRIYISGTIGEEHFTLADLALHGLLQPGITSIELLVANGMGGEEGATNRYDAVGGETH